LEGKYIQKINVKFARTVIGKPRVTAGGVVSRIATSFPFPNGFRALPVTELGYRQQLWAVQRTSVMA
jgi:hypothetical protein